MPHVVGRQPTGGASDPASQDEVGDFFSGIISIFDRFHLPILPSQCWMSLRRSLSSFATAYTAAPGKEHLGSSPSLCLFLEGALLFRAAQPRMDSAVAALFGVVGKDTASKLMTSDGTATGSFMHSYTRSIMLVT